MFNKNSWTIMDYICDECNELSFLNIILQVEDISIYIPEQIKKEDDHIIVKYDYDTFINDLFESFSSYEDIKSQAIKDTNRSDVILNGVKLNSRNILKIEELIETMNIYYLSQTEKYTILMLITQGVFGLPYNYVLNEYKNYHLGELNYTEKTKGYNRMKIIISLNCNKKKIIINKKLRLFTIDDNEDTTYKILNFTINANLIKKKIAFRVKEIK
jgi:hypothetical protein